MNYNFRFMIDESFTSNSEDETIEFGRQLGHQLTTKDVVALHGPLGSGKTHLVKGIAQALGIKKSAVHSPTYTLIHEYEGKMPLYHFDCYRMKSVEEALEIGAEDYFYREGISAIEWPEKIRSILPEEVIWVNIKTKGKTQRIFEMEELLFN